MGVQVDRVEQLVDGGDLDHSGRIAVGHDVAVADLDNLRETRGPRGGVMPEDAVGIRQPCACSECRIGCRRQNGLQAELPGFELGILVTEVLEHIGQVGH